MSASESYFLILEDSRVLLNILTQWFRETFPGKPVVGVASIEAAHEALAALSIDLFLIDYTLPDGSGLDFMSDVRTVFPEARFIMMTLEMPEHERAAMMTLHPVGYFRKPLDFRELEWALRANMGGGDNSPVAGPGAGFKTMLHNATALDLIQLQCMDVATCAMEFRNGARQLGRVYFAKGEIIHAETEAAIGIEALSEIIRWKNGDAQQLTNWAQPKATTIGPPWSCALMEAAQLADEKPSGSGAASH